MHDATQPSDPALPTSMTSPEGPIHAVVYARASTSKQETSIGQQLLALSAYADRHGYRIVRSFLDQGRSGLTLQGRPGLSALLDAAVSADPGFTVILVYDISRWGRFQDTDEGASYEYLCRSRGIQVIYCAELPMPETPLAGVIKQLKRTMAAEYSRELSEKVKRTKLLLARQGYLQGEVHGFGLQRVSRRADGTSYVLPPGERSLFPSAHVRMQPGDPTEVACVQRIFELYVHERRSCRDIACTLERDGATTPTGGHWTESVVWHLLTRQRYCGRYVYNRTTETLQTRPRINPASEHVRVEGALQALVSPDLWARAQAIRALRSRPHDTTELLDTIRRIHHAHGRVSISLLRAGGLRSVGPLVKRFGGVLAAYRAAGLPEHESADSMARRIAIRQWTGTLLSRVLALIDRTTITASPLPAPNTLQLSTGQTLRVQVTTRRHRRGHPSWCLRLRPDLAVDFILAGCLNEDTTGFDHYLLIPTFEYRAARLIDNGRGKKHARRRTTDLAGLFGLPSE